MNKSKDKKDEKVPEEEKGRKKPYDPYGYNTPKKTNFRETLHTEEIILAADKAAGEKFEESYVSVEDFQEAEEQVRLGQEMAEKEGKETEAEEEEK